MSLRPVFCLAAVLAVSPILPAAAQTLSAAQAQGSLYPAAGVEVLQYDVTGLNENEVQALLTVANTQPYYAAVAFAPDAGILAEPTVMAANYHNSAAARQAALSGCEGRRNGGRPCELALETRPAGWQERPLTLSADATTAFNEQYLAGAGTRAMAISASSGQWGIGAGNGAAQQALSACQGDSQVSDCAVVIAD